MNQFPANQEIFRAISGYVNYEVSNHGRIRNSVTGIIMKPRINGGYNRINLSLNGNKHTKFID